MRKHISEPDANTSGGLNTLFGTLRSKLINVSSRPWVNFTFVRNHHHQTFQLLCNDRDTTLQYMIFSNNPQVQGNEPHLGFEGGRLIEYTISIDNVVGTRTSEDVPFGIVPNFTFTGSHLQNVGLELVPVSRNGTRQLHEINVALHGRDGSVQLIPIHVIITTNVSNSSSPTFKLNVNCPYKKLPVIEGEQASEHVYRDNPEYSFRIV